VGFSIEPIKIAVKLVEHEWQTRFYWPGVDCLFIPGTLQNGGGVAQCGATSLIGAEVSHSPREVIAVCCEAMLSKKTFPVFMCFVRDHLMMPFQNCSMMASKTKLV